MKIQSLGPTEGPGKTAAIITTIIPSSSGCEFCSVRLDMETRPCTHPPSHNQVCTASSFIMGPRRRGR
ncbi:hypothetical protein BZA05DRAFT_475399 [Tricharina praecox]|uniref:uncharacterized protein n=1 Tax=Tricharina praecox TaxID=43433 RepID=UPI002220C3A8|nr:uncharacterized protein BZA05DRAFT_475399 [Tricharina praecox]KAI5848329.1 hypothetical protein BZA05DRAFT_475399 [Tricharina praecox]